MRAMPASRTNLLALAALGIVFGDIGTSPLYTLSTCFQFSGAAPTPANVLGICSLLVWVLILVVCVKYVAFILAADHDGEGGILALLALAGARRSRYAPIAAGALTTIVIAGAAMLLGDGMITPAISVISAIEGLNVVTPAAQPFIVPISVGILIALFAVQSRGTHAVGSLFGPVMLAWFAAIAVAGAFGIATDPAVLWSIDPRHALAFLTGHGPGGFLVLAGVVLAVTGVEALYADLSHFGRVPIARAWYAVVFPALLLCYLGQGARVIDDPKTLAQSFFALSPGWTLLPMIAIATAATIIASQALISGAFTLVEQAVALGLWPRTTIRHTSSVLRGQVFVPAVNRTLAVGCVALVIGFGSSEKLAAAFGLAVSCTMLATSIAYFVVIRRIWNWPAVAAVPLVGAFAIVDGAFILAGLPKIVNGGWFPFAVAAVFTIASTTWLEGRRRTAQALAEQETPLTEAFPYLMQHAVSDTPIMVLLSGDPEHVPFFARHRWLRDRAREERVVLLTLVPAQIPYVAEADRITTEVLAPALTRVIARFGYMELPDIAPIVAACVDHGIDLKRSDTSFFYADPKIERAEMNAFPTWRRELFIALRHIARPLSDDLHIEAERRIELGVTVPI
jgi:KUP system potassium uptake protein